MIHHLERRVGGIFGKLGCSHASTRERCRLNFEFTTDHVQLKHLFFILLIKTSFTVEISVEAGR